MNKAGRPPVTDKATKRSLKLNDRHWRIFTMLGRAKWLRKILDDSNTKENK